MTPTRRTILASIAAAPLLAAVPSPARTRVVLLGTKGGPTPSPYRAAPATLIEIGGGGVGGRLRERGGGAAGQGGVKLDALARMFVTQTIAITCADVGNLIELAWSAGPVRPVTVYGPPPIRQIVRDQLAALDYDVQARIREEGRVPLAPLVSVDERAVAGLVLRADGVTVTSALVDHESVTPAFAYRFDTPGRSIVISGDTTYSDNLVALAKGADLLIHEAIYARAIPRMAGENARTLADHLRRSHATTEQVGMVAAKAGVKKLVLSHLVPADPAISDAMWLAGVRRYFGGEAVVGRDLMAV